MLWILTNDVGAFAVSDVHARFVREYGDAPPVVSSHPEWWGSVAVHATRPALSLPAERFPSTPVRGHWAFTDVIGHALTRAWPGDTCIALIYPGRPGSEQYVIGALLHWQASHWNIPLVTTSAVTAYTPHLLSSLALPLPRLNLHGRQEEDPSAEGAGPQTPAASSRSIRFRPGSGS